jgi:hypothetical protein
MLEMIHALLKSTNLKLFIYNLKEVVTTKKLHLKTFIILNPLKYIYYEKIIIPFFTLFYFTK